MPKKITDVSDKPLFELVRTLQSDGETRVTATTHVGTHEGIPAPELEQIIKLTKLFLEDMQQRYRQHAQAQRPKRDVFICESRDVHPDPY